MATPADVTGEPSVADTSAFAETSEVTVPDELKCGLCVELYKEPKVLPCCHTFCRACLDRLIEKSTDKRKLTCPHPQCRFEHKVSENGAGDFLTDYTTVRELEMHQLSTSKERAICEGCETTDPPVAYCNDCRAFLCDFCATAHMRMKLCRNHRVLPLENLEESILGRKVLFCIWHPTCGEPMKIYCKTCEIPVCCHCIVASHQAHILVSIDQDTRREVQSKMSSLSNSAQQKLSRFEENMIFINQVERRAVSRPAELKSAINTTFDSIAAVLETRRAQLLEEAEIRSSSDLLEVGLQKEFIEMTVGSLKSALGFTDRTFRCDSDIEFLSLSAQTTNRLEEMEKMKWDSGSVAKIECTAWRFNPGGDHVTYIQKIGTIEEYIEPIDAEVIFQNLPASIELGKKVEFKLIAQTQKAKRLIGLEPGSMLDVKIRYGKSQKATMVQPNKNPDGSWTVRFTPVASGIHTIQVSLRGIVKSPANQFECKTNVIGIPAVGARVCRGPDWSCGNEDGGEESGGKVNSNDYSPDEVLYIVWDNGNGYSYAWGNSGRYQVELQL